MERPQDQTYLAAPSDHGLPKLTRMQRGPIGRHRDPDETTLLGPTHSTEGANGRVTLPGYRFKRFYITLEGVLFWPSYILFGCILTSFIGTKRF